MNQGPSSRIVPPSVDCRLRKLNNTLPGIQDREYEGEFPTLLETLPATPASIIKEEAPVTLVLNHTNNLFGEWMLAL